MTDHDQLKLACAVGVFDADDYYRQQLSRIVAREEKRRARWGMIGNIGAGVLLFFILGICLILSFTMGPQA